MANKKLEITPKNSKGEDGYKTFSIRIKEELCANLDTIASETGRSRNELVALFIEYGLDNCEIVK
ncbi:MAG: CopG family transcriptional regulator [Oscillospiraceae bacterium]|nr:CopG family transcriptional regulator [Oscillospiraceae bacterium]